VLYMLETYGITNLPSLTFAYEVKGQEVAWTLGMAIDKSIKLIEVPDEPNSSTTIVEIIKPIEQYLGLSTLLYFLTKV